MNMIVTALLWVSFAAYFLSSVKIDQLSSILLLLGDFVLLSVRWKGQPWCYVLALQPMHADEPELNVVSSAKDNSQSSSIASLFTDARPCPMDAWWSEKTFFGMCYFENRLCTLFDSLPHSAWANCNANHSNRFEVVLVGLINHIVNVAQLTQVKPRPCLLSLCSLFITQ